MTASFNQTLTFTPVGSSLEDVGSFMTANVYSVIFISKSRDQFRANGGDNVNQFIVIAEREESCVPFVVDWYTNMAQTGLPLDLYDVTIHLLVKGVITPRVGVINGVYRW